MYSKEFEIILNTLKVDDIRHIKIEWYNRDDLNVLEYHQIKAYKEDNNENN